VYFLAERDGMSDAGGGGGGGHSHSHHGVNPFNTTMHARCVAASLVHARTRFLTRSLLQDCSSSPVPRISGAAAEVVPCNRRDGCGRRGDVACVDWIKGPGATRGPRV
jgi:hypothetical protein